MNTRVDFFKSEMKTGGKFHLTVGSTTVHATVTFFGALEVSKDPSGHGDGLRPPAPGLYASQATYLSSYGEGEGSADVPAPVAYNYAIIALPRPVTVPPRGRMIGSRLDVSSAPCRVAFTADVLWGGGKGPATSSTGAR